jgi:methyl-accepting chemotaxis protein
MNLLGNLPIARKLPLVFGGALALLAAGGLYGIHRLGEANAVHASVLDGEIAHERVVAQMLLDFKLQVQEWKDTLLRGKDPKQLEKYWSAFQAQETMVGDTARKLQNVLPPGEAQRLVARFAEAHAEMGRHYHAAFDAFKAAGFDPIVGDAAVKGIDRPPSELLARARNEIAANASEAAAKAIDGARRARLISLVLMGLVSCLGVLAGLLISRSIVRPIEEAVRVAQTVAGGDLTSEIRIEREDEIGQLLMSLRLMNDSLVRIVSQVRDGADSIATASRQIAAGNQDLSGRTEQQASSLQQTAASMEQLTSTVHQSTQNAKQANQLAGAASDAAENGGNVVNRVISTMDEIAGSSKRMAEIINVIDGIAFQTNILALNAAVEAARAGEQGRGFAVVAGEVRSLAQRSSQAAREIKEMIQDSVDKVDAGSRLVADAGKSMGEIVTQVKRVTDLIADITASAVEQSSGIAQVNVAVTQMDQATQQNSALVEQSAAAAHSLKDQAGALAQTVAVFKLERKASTGCAVA